MLQVMKMLKNSRLQNGVNSYCRCLHGQNNKDVTQQVQTTASTTPDLLLQNIRTAANTGKLLDIVSMHNNVMNHKHVIQALRTLFTLQKHGNSEISTKYLLKHPTFTKLCQRLKTQAAQIELNDSIDALKVVSYVGVPAQSTIVQILLQLIRQNINFLTLKQIIFMEFLLTKSRHNFDKDNTPLVEALKLALPIVFDVNLPLKMDRDDVNALTSYLFYAASSTNGLSASSIELICDALLQPHIEFTHAQISKSVVWSICDMPVSSELCEPLLKKALKALTVHLDELNYNDVDTTLSKLVRNYASEKYAFYYDELFFDSCTNYLIANARRRSGEFDDFKTLLYVLRKFIRINYSNNYLCDYISKQLYQHPEYITTNSLLHPEDIYNIVLYMSLTPYRPVYWTELKQRIIENGHIISNLRKDVLWLHLGTALCILDIFQIDVLKKCLDEQYLTHQFGLKKNHLVMDNIEHYLAIWHGIELYKPELKYLLPTKFTPEYLIKHSNSSIDFDHPLESSLQAAFGGENYVKSGLLSRCAGRVIDHLVIFRKGGYPIAINLKEGSQFIEDIEVVADNQLVCILSLNHSHYTINNTKERMKSTTNLFINYLQSKGYYVATVCLESWMALADFEKIAYLTQNINSQLDLSSSSNNSSKFVSNVRL